jgi:hypothetical protein
MAKTVGDRRHGAADRRVCHPADWAERDGHAPGRETLRGLLGRRQCLSAVGGPAGWGRTRGDGEPDPGQRGGRRDVDRGGPGRGDRGRLGPPGCRRSDRRGERPRRRDARRQRARLRFGLGTPAPVRHGVPAVHVREGKPDTRGSAGDWATYRRAPTTAAATSGLLTGTPRAATELGGSSPAASRAIALQAEGTKNPPGDPTWG